MRVFGVLCAVAFSYRHHANVFLTSFAMYFCCAYLCAGYPERFVGRAAEAE